MGGYCIEQELVWVDKLVFAKEVEDSDSRHSMWRAQALGRQLAGVQEQLARKFPGQAPGTFKRCLWILSLVACDPNH